MSIPFVTVGQGDAVEQFVIGHVLYESRLQIDGPESIASSGRRSIRRMTACALGLIQIVDLAKSA
jgi:hypothetical protein